MPASYVKEYTDFSSDIDLAAEAAAASLKCPNITRFEVVTAGSGGLSALLHSGQTITLTGLGAGHLDIKPRAILSSGSTITKVRVWWEQASPRF